MQELEDNLIYMKILPLFLRIVIVMVADKFMET